MAPITDRDISSDAVLRVAAILRARHLHADSPGLDYGPLRHRTLPCVDGLAERFSYVDYHRTESVAVPDGTSTRRRVWSWYRPWIAGQLVDIQPSPVEYPFCVSVSIPTSIVFPCVSNLTEVVGDEAVMHCSTSQSVGRR